jgi:hypothetical protein
VTAVAEQIFNFAGDVQRVEQEKTKTRRLRAQPQERDDPEKSEQVEQEKTPKKRPGKKSAP